MSTLSLYTVAGNLLPLLENGIDEDGVMSEELGAALAQFEGKGEAVTAYVLNLQATADATKAAADKLLARADRLQAKADRIKHYLAFNMRRTGITEIAAHDGTFAAKLQIERDASVQVFDAKQIPAEYMRTPEPKPPVAAPDKKAIAAAIKAGIDVPGAKIVKNDRLVIG